MPYAISPYYNGARLSIKRRGGAGCLRGILLARNWAYRLRDVRQAGGGSGNVGVWLWLFAMEPGV